MRDVTIRDYIGNAKELTAAEVRKLPEGTAVTVHSFDRYGSHQTLDAVVYTGTNRHLLAHDYAGMPIHRPIKKENDRLCYTVS